MGRKQEDTSSWRVSPLPPNWSILRRVVLMRDNYQCQGIRGRNVPCKNTATEVDHIRGRDNHSMSNLQSLCHICHARKTQSESTASKKAALKPRGREKHPYA